MVLFVWFVLITYMFLVWGVYRLLRNPAIVDVAWSFGLMLSGFIYLSASALSLRTFVLGTLLTLWGLRLGLYLWFTRIRIGLIDARYEALSDSWTIAKPLGFFLNFQLQACFILIIATPWCFVGASSQESLSYIDIFGIVLFFIGLAGESLADSQLQSFKKNPSGKVCRLGLWSHSRHPNYFFEWLIWCSFAVFGLSHPYGFLGFISPLSLYFLMTKITAPMTEMGSIKSRGHAYVEYQKSTPMFFPRIMSCAKKQ